MAAGLPAACIPGSHACSRRPPTCVLSRALPVCRASLPIARAAASGSVPASAVADAAPRWVPASTIWASSLGLGITYRSNSTTRMTPTARPSCAAQGRAGVREGERRRGGAG